MDLHQKINKIQTKEDFLAFLNLYIENLKRQSEMSSDKSITSFLEGVESWVEDMEGYYENTNQDLPDDVNWKIFADILYAAKMYE